MNKRFISVLIVPLKNTKFNYDTIKTEIRIRNIVLINYQSPGIWKDLKLKKGIFFEVRGCRWKWD